MTTILLSEALATRRGADILAAAGPGATLLRMRADGSLDDPGRLPQADVAFLSTDLMGAANKNQPGARLATFTGWLDAGTGLRWVHTCSAGTDRPVLQRLMRRGVTVTTSSGANAMSVAHSAVAGLLALARDVPHWIESRQRRTWSPLRERGHLPRDLDGTHAVVVGFGPIGQAIARACRALGMRVTAVRREATPHPDADAVCALRDLHAIAPGADWLILCCPLTAQTRGLVDAALLRALPAEAGLINVARGEVVDEAALFEAIGADRLLAGVYSDVFVEEPPPPDSPWWTLPRTLMSPHCGGLSAGFAGRTIEAFVANLRRYVAGQVLHNVARPAT
jgi:D-2-hydroxyacid dehydrogenase (NADP+)